MFVTTTPHRHLHLRRVLPHLIAPTIIMHRNIRRQQRRQRLDIPRDILGKKVTPPLKDLPDGILLPDTHRQLTMRHSQITIHPLRTTSHM